MGLCLAYVPNCDVIDQTFPSLYSLKKKFSIKVGDPSRPVLCVRNNPSNRSNSSMTKETHLAESTK